MYTIIIRGKFMWYSKNKLINNAFIQCTDKWDETFVEMDDSLFSSGFDGCLYLKSFLENPDEEYLKREEEQTNYSTIMDLKRYLLDTDYVVSKLNELKLEDEAEYEAEKAKYADILKKRKEARAKINELEGK